MTDFIQPPGELSRADELSVVAQGYLAAVEQSPNFKLVETRRSANADFLVVDAFAGIPPRSPHGVQDVERLAIEVARDREPVVHALRADFPHLPHQNLVAAGSPRQLCLSEVPWQEERSTETPPRRLRRITEWLERAAWGRLYAPGQPLEPYVFSIDRLVVSRDVFDAGLGTPYAVVKDGELLRVRAIGELPASVQAKYVVMPILVTATDAQVVHSIPVDFGQLAGLLEPLGTDLVELVRGATMKLAGSGASHMLRLHWLFLVRIPRITPDRSTDSEDIAFLLERCTIAELGEAIGAVAAGGGMIGLDLGELVGEKREYDLGQGCPVPLNPVPELTSTIAARMSGHEAPSGDQLVSIVGVGAIGSSIALNLARQGDMPSVLIDHDVVLPHNLARYQLPPAAIGLGKAECVALLASGTCSDVGAAQFFKENILQIEDDSEVAQAMGRTQLIVDCTTSRAAMRRLARMEGLKRRVSCYVTASTTDLVVIAEGTDHSPRIDDLDVQFAHQCGTDPNLSGVMVSGQGARVRYAGGCSDLSAVLDASAVMTLSAIATSRIQRVGGEDGLTIKVWHYDRSGPSVEALDVGTSHVSVKDFVGGWQLRMSDSAVEQMQGFRLDKLPDETGGVLLGAHDVCRRVVYVTGVLPSPPDSEEWPTSYIRGSKGLRAQVESVSRLSGNEIGYVGEWHSHSMGCLASLSADDMQALAELAISMGREGLPGVVVVVSDREQWEPGLTFLM